MSEDAKGAGERPGDEKPKPVPKTEKRSFWRKNGFWAAILLFLSSLCVSLMIFQLNQGKGGGEEYYALIPIAAFLLIASISLASRSE